MSFYTKVSYFDEENDVEEYETREEAYEAYCGTLEMQRDGVMGDVASISYGHYTLGGVCTCFARKNFE